mmetsp:Transcript_4128/g.13077  ORF Transcript_4128/g.13077 Transcript_4128/m.13077 type:complete len:268 (+) Transcript_4128:845-1648(+)
MSDLVTRISSANWMGGSFSRFLRGPFASTSSVNVKIANEPSSPAENRNWSSWLAHMHVMFPAWAEKRRSLSSWSSMNSGSLRSCIPSAPNGISSLPSSATASPSVFVSRLWFELRGRVSITVVPTAPCWPAVRLPADSSCHSSGTPLSVRVANSVRPERAITSCSNFIPGGARTSKLMLPLVMLTSRSSVPGLAVHRATLASTSQATVLITLEPFRMYSASLRPSLTHHRYRTPSPAAERSSRSSEVQAREWMRPACPRSVSRHSKV